MGGGDLVRFACLFAYFNNFFCLTEHEKKLASSDVAEPGESLES